MQKSMSTYVDPFLLIKVLTIGFSRQLYNLNRIQLIMTSGLTSRTRILVGIIKGLIFFFPKVSVVHVKILFHVFPTPAVHMRLVPPPPPPPPTYVPLTSNVCAWMLDCRTQRCPGISMEWRTYQGSWVLTTSSAPTSST